MLLDLNTPVQQRQCQNKVRIPKKSECITQKEGCFKDTYIYIKTLQAKKIPPEAFRVTKICTMQYYFSLNINTVYTFRNCCLSATVSSKCLVSRIPQPFPEFSADSLYRYFLSIVFTKCLGNGCPLGGYCISIHKGNEKHLHFSTQGVCHTMPVISLLVCHNLDTVLRQ